MKNTSKILMAAILLFGSLVLTGCAGSSESESTPNQANTSSTQSSFSNNTQSTVDRGTQSVIKNTQSTSDSSTQSAAESSEGETNGDSVTFDGFKISFDTERAMNVFTIDNQFSELNGRKVYAVPMTIENTGGETKGINMFYVKAFGPSGTELDSVFAYFPEAQDFYKEMRSGTKVQTAYYMLDDGSGEYYIVFKSFAEEKELKVNIA